MDKIDPTKAVEYFERTQGWIEEQVRFRRKIRGVRLSSLPAVFYP
jgi:hypothetical protein